MPVGLQPARPSLSNARTSRDVKGPPGALKAPVIERAANARAALLKARAQIAGCPGVVQQYTRVGMMISPATAPRVTHFGPGSEICELGGGAFNTTYLVTLGAREDKAVQQEVVFKPLPEEEDGAVAAKTGIPRRKAATPMRNLATQRCAEALRLNVVAKRHVGIFGGQSVRGCAGLMMELASGRVAADVPSHVLAQPEVVREVTRLQWLDHLTGQGDRHAGNYFIHFDPQAPAGGRAKVTGIDDDQCFGKDLLDPNGIADTGGDCPFRGTRMPPVIDRELADRLKALTPRDLRNMLRGKLTRQEIAATVTRLEAIKNHIQFLERERRVLSRVDDWSAPKFQGLMTVENSYWGRELLDRDRDDDPFGDGVRMPVGVIRGS